MLRRELGLREATAMVVGIIVGASIFVQPAEVTRYVGSWLALALVWLGAGLLTLLGARVMAELAAAFPQTGGVYVFLQRTIAPSAGFTWGWAMFWSMHSGIIAAIAVVAARYCGIFIALSATGEKVAAMAAILGLSAVNVLGVRRGGRLQAWLTAIKVAAIAALVAVVVALAPARVPVPPPLAAVAMPGLGGFLLAVSAGLFAFGGWHMVTYAAGETREAERTIPRALVLGVLIVTACYLALNAAYLRVLPLAAVRTSTRIAADAAAVLLGARGAVAVSALVVVSALGSLNGIILAGPRVYFAMAKDGLAPPALARTQARWHTPYLALGAQAVWSCVLVATGSYRSLFTRVVYTEWLFFGLCAVGLMRWRRAWAWGPGLFAAACALVVVNEVVAAPASALTGLAFVAAGVPVYYAARHYFASGRHRELVGGHGAGGGK